MRNYTCFGTPPSPEVSQQPVAKLPWGHNIALLANLDNQELRLWYAKKAIEHGWSRNVLQIQIESKLHVRQGSAITNFERTLPSPQSDLARQITKDPYNFEFLTLQADAEERELEKGLVAQIQRFLLELGAGFAFAATNITWRSMATISTSTCCSIT